MADVTGTVREEYAGNEYRMRLTWRSIATLQAEYGNNVSGLLDGTAGDNPPFAPMLDIISLALQKGEKMEASRADDLADEMLTANPDLLERVLKTAFPDAVVEGAKSGNAKRPRRSA